MRLTSVRNRLKKYIRLVAGREPVLVTDGGEVVAELGPPQSGDPLGADGPLADAIRSGWLAPPVIVRRNAPRRAPVMGLEEVLAEIEDDRGNR